MTDEEAKSLLRQIYALAMSPYPLAPGSAVSELRLLALGYIAGVASAACADPPRFTPGEDAKRRAERPS